MFAGRPESEEVPVVGVVVVLAALESAVVVVLPEAVVLEAPEGAVGIVAVVLVIPVGLG